ncbi:helix-turn-helix domain-containing protein [Streptomyces albulus]|uniref:helix-turn-helix domain-containing protein n=1 Tax=Streptomyces noursei TaxID=1971 RepID=UPI001F2E5BDB|nr:helix-turn-helix transcriptional regulator [Streptomyces noursei]MCE4942327.1 helix-turn-helix domain-containing protein [Streptomyces noursei]
MDISADFGSELRRLRQEAGISLPEFAQDMNYSKGYLSKLERGLARPSRALARRCDAELRTGGRLEELVEPQGGAGGRARGVDRRTALLTGAGSLVAAGLGAPTRAIHLVSATDPVELFREQLRQMRRLGQCATSAVLLPLLTAQTNTLTALASGSDAATRGQLLVLAARFAEYAGWMAQEAGDTSAALSWTADAVELARAGGDRDLSSYALVRRALVTMYDGDAAGTVALARQAQRAGVPQRIRGLAAQREAQGHALAGDERACLRGIDRARELLTSAEPPNGNEPVIGSANLCDSAAMVTGWCLYDLGRCRNAAEVLDEQCPNIPTSAVRARTRYGLRRALAHAAGGNVEESCAIATDLLPLAVTVSSATVRTDVVRLTRELSRFRSHRVVRDLQPALIRASTSAQH